MKGPLISLTGVEPVENFIQDELKGEHRVHVSIFDWPIDEGRDDSDEEGDEVVDQVEG